MRSHRLAITLAFGPATVAMLLLPLLFMLLPNRSASRLDDLDGAGHGVFAIADGEAYRLLPRAPSAAPSTGIVTLSPTLELRVRSRQFADLGEYRLTEEESGDVVALSVERSGPYLVMRPRATLAAGLYRALIPRDSLYAETDSYFVRVGRNAH